MTLIDQETSLPKLHLYNRDYHVNLLGFLGIMLDDIRYLCVIIIIGSSHRRKLLAQ